jgi:hypothetical protein
MQILDAARSLATVPLANLFPHVELHVADAIILVVVPSFRCYDIRLVEPLPSCKLYGGLRRFKVCGSDYDISGCFADARRRPAICAECQTCLLMST